MKYLSVMASIAWSDIRDAETWTGPKAGSPLATVQAQWRKIMKGANCEAETSKLEFPKLFPEKTWRAYIFQNRQWQHKNLMVIWNYDSGKCAFVQGDPDDPSVLRPSFFLKVEIQSITYEQHRPLVTLPRETRRPTSDGAYRLNFIQTSPNRTTFTNTNGAERFTPFELQTMPFADTRCYELLAFLAGMRREVAIGVGVATETRVSALRLLDCLPEEHLPNSFFRNAWGMFYSVSDQGSADVILIERRTGDIFTWNYSA